MNGEINLQKLIREMKPRLNDGEFVYCAIATQADAVDLNPLCMFLEQESVTVILPKNIADKAGLTYPSICAWITLTIHSSLEAVGLTAAVSTALADANISCNMVAAFYHDHIFVPVKDAERAMDVLHSLTGNHDEQ